MKQAMSPSNPINTPGAAGLPGAADQQHRCGTLRYTAGGILTLFFWLLWGDFCFTLMETIAGSVMPWKFKALNASNTTTCPACGSVR